MTQWLLARPQVSDPAELAYFRAFGPAETPLADLVRVAGMRWAIEESLEDVKGAVGLDEYEVRKWGAWYRHITLALVAHAYLEVIRIQANAADQEGSKKGDLQPI
jgi:SRSO17 transposase